MRMKLDETSEKLLETQGKLEDLESKYEYERNKWEESQESLKSSANISQSQFQEMQRTIEDLKLKNKTEIERLTNEIQDTVDQARFKEEELDALNKEKEDDVLCRRCNPELMGG